MDSIHFQKFCACSSYVRPYGSLSGGKMLNELEAEAGANVE
jgi:hypothetical protein